MMRWLHIKTSKVKRASAIRHKCVRLFHKNPGHCQSGTKPVFSGNDLQQSPRYNALGIQMLSQCLHKQIFKECYVDEHRQSHINQRLEESIEHLSKFDLWGKEPETIEDFDFKIPELKGKNINQHFHNIALQQAGAYAKALHKLISSQLPPKPNENEWAKEPGWTKYVCEGDGSFTTTPVDYPECSALVFDCEVLANLTDIPIIAVAASENAWYSWTSHHVFMEKSKLDNELHSLVPMESIVNKPFNPKKTSTKLIVGHNVGYDRARIKEQYYPQLTNARFLDTMSMHIAVSGFNGQQKMLSRASHKEEPVDKKTAKANSTWLDSGSLNNLSDVHRFYCGTALDKSVRNIFIEGTMDDVKQGFHKLMDYCSRDVHATHDVLVKLTPLFFSHFPHLVTFAGMLEMGQMYLPVNKNWDRFVRSCQDEYESLNMELKSNLMDLMNDACHLSYNDNYKADKWLWDMDWSTQCIKLLKSPRKGYQPEAPKLRKLPDYFPAEDTFSDEEKLRLGKLCKDNIGIHNLENSLFQKLCETANRLPKVRTHMPGTPKWYNELHYKENDPNWSISSTKLSTLTRPTPRLLRMTWLGYPLHHQDKLGWGYLVPKGQKSLEGYAPPNITHDENALQEITEKDAVLPNVGVTHTPAEDVEGIPPDCTFHRLPHKNGIGHNVGNPLAQDFINHIESGLLSSADCSNALRCLGINKLCSYWRSAERRIVSQMRIGLDKSVLPPMVTDNPDFTDELVCGAIVPQVTVCGAISRRAVERTWLTASNTEEDRIGSELKSMIQAPPGFDFVGADVDSQELWIASLLGDASSIGEHGCTAMSWMTLQGNKKDGTDLHSRTAQAIGMTRNDAKMFNYARMYGAGKQSSLRVYMQHNQDEPKSECMKKINALYKMTKGELFYKLSTDGLWFMKKLNVRVCGNTKMTGYATFNEVKQIMNAATDSFGHIKAITNSDLVAGTKWIGGIESHMFNKVSEIATNDMPRTPVLKCEISNALKPSRVRGNFLPSRMNWVVQSSAVDYLHLLLVSMRWLIKEYNLEARFMLSIHDEIRYMVSKKHSHLIALALQISNLLTRCMFAEQMGMKDLPLSVAFFSSVEIDQVIRKEATDNCITPSNINGLESKYGIPLGKSMDIHDILHKTNGGCFDTNSEITE